MFLGTSLLEKGNKNEQLVQNSTFVSLRISL